MPGSIPIVSIDNGDIPLEERLRKHASFQHPAAGSSNVPILSAKDVVSRLDEGHRDRFLDYLLTTSMDPENHVPCYRSILTCQMDDSLSQVFKRLSNEGFTSCPVLQGKEFVGFVDMLDLVKFTTNMFWGCTVADWVDFWQKESTFKNALISQVLDKQNFPFASTSSSLTRRPEPIYADNTTFHALEVMVRTNAHRIPIFDNRRSKNLVGIFTQSMLISECFQRENRLSRTFKEKKVSEMTGLFSDIVTINQSKTAINAFNLMCQQNITGLAVVNDEGTLIDNISVKDLRGVGTDGKKFTRLFDNIKEFKRKVRRDYPIAAPLAHYSMKLTPSEKEPLFVTPDSTFIDVLRMMDDGNIHRVYVCSDYSTRRGKPRPIHVITQTDMLKQILHNFTTNNL